jgi:REP element-mobilizing transposase RayT
MPSEVVVRLKQEHEGIRRGIQKVKSVSEQEKLRRESGVSYFKHYDDFLDSATDGPLWLREESVAAKVAETIRAQDGQYYDLLAFCLMPNHVHLLATLWEFPKNTAECDVERSLDRFGLTGVDGSRCDERTEVRFTPRQYLLTNILRRIKGVTAYECNKLLNRRGAFWHHESYDHVVRNVVELERTVWYILENPVKAGLCRQWRDWKWSYVKEGLIELPDNALPRPQGITGT